MLVINKPACIPVHKGRGGGENLEDYFGELCYGLPRNPSLAHRLDKDTSGCLVLGRHRKALQKLGKLFEQGKVQKTYWAIVEGAPLESEGRIELRLKKANLDPRSWKMMAADDGQEAITDYKILGKHENKCWLELKPLTGRTHQLRVHCAAMGFPIVGDKIYGTDDGQPLQLHARAVVVPLYANKEPITVEAAPPEHMIDFLQRMNYKKTHLTL